MKLLFDQNISHRLVQALQKEYPDSRHVREVGLQEAADAVVWQYAAQQGFASVRGILTVRAPEVEPSSVVGWIM